jgi:glycosyltransferase involved in cell wall biosynthesis
MRHNRLLCLLQWLERKMYAMADHVVTVGECYSQALRERGVPPDKISVVMNGVDPEVFRPRAPDLDLRRQLGLNGEFVCGYVGTVGMACGLDVVLRAAQLLGRKNRCDVRFLIVGDGATRSKLQTEAEHLGLRNVIFTGLQPKAMVPKYLSITDACLIHLRKNEVFRSVLPSKIFEAAGAAKPIIIGVEGFAKRFVLNAGAGMAVEPENERQLVEAILRMVDDPALCRKWGEAGCRHVMMHHTRDLCAERYLGIVEKVLGGAADIASVETMIPPSRCQTQVVQISGARALRGPIRRLPSSSPEHNNATEDRKELAS